MKYIKFNKHDYLVLFVTVLPFMIVVCYLLVGEPYFEWPLFGKVTLIALVLGVLAWVLHIIAANIIIEKIPNHTRILYRIIIQLPVYVILTQVSIGFFTFAVFNLLGILHEPLNWANYKPVFFAGLILNIVATCFHEGTMFFEKWKASLIETEKLKKMNLQSQLDSLKNQVNPHFLFNSLNSLSSLISSDPEKATEFLDEMSKVYRYLLRANDSELIPLASELEFAASFFHMLKTRYENGIEMQVDVPKENLEDLIPPLTLQMLIENAVKHNAILKQSPLRIDISVDHDNRLVVYNNIQKKQSRIISNKIGLQNIISKYQLLNQPAVQIEQTEASFRVALPLIKTS
ncbi:hypothetical protein EOD41_04225 [Mucilaginibacter limnophilus]|uniref:Signal transduction histidine kinase internal region domain-containing protein n=1 Tax=Mucilaginibacter limnophilus TaxID=1932778 RepID=A0A437MZQ1_9SPHI|nr:histidine kinase [Mucilaginibacter limnophilus]RVU03145.1 hypothetical protein EOD41_04225 [Mucilaginibacter limnophilus]